jgi:hypothetical protein
LASWKNGAAIADWQNMLAKFFTALMVTLTGLIPSSCTKAKSPSAQKSAPVATATAAAKSNSQNLGELELTNHYETCIQLGAGKSCTIRPNVLDRGNLQLTLALETKKSDGKVSGLSVVQVVAQSGKSFDVAVGDMNLTLTPNVGE